MNDKPGRATASSAGRGRRKHRTYRCAGVIVVRQRADAQMNAKSGAQFAVRELFRI